MYSKQNRADTIHNISLDIFNSKIHDWVHSNWQKEPVNHTLENSAITEAIFLSWLHRAEINNFGKLFNGVSLDKFNTTSNARLYLVLDFVSMKTKYNSQETSHRLGFNFEYFEYYTVTLWLLFSHIKSLKYRALITMCLLTEWEGCRGKHFFKGPM